MILYTVLQVATGLITVFVGIIALYDIIISLKIKNVELKKLPIRIIRSLSYSKFYKAMIRFSAILDELRFVPDVILGIHYQGTAFASILAKQLYKPIYTAVIHYHIDHNGHHKCDSVVFNFDPASIFRDKKVLIVDNGIKSGMTMSKVKNEVLNYTRTVKTAVIYNKTAFGEFVENPDYVIFYSRKPLQFLR